jgi:1-deoxy-D-xylulose-5-phosphate synthase
MYTACRGVTTPFVIRYPRGKGEKKDWRNEPELLPIGKGKKLREGKRVAVLSLGPIGNVAAKAIDLLGETNQVAHYDMLWLKPMDEGILHEVGRNFQAVVTVENGVVTGGLGSAVLEFMADHDYKPRVRRIGIPDRFVEHGALADLYRLCGMDAESITKAIKDLL